MDWLDTCYSYLKQLGPWNKKIVENFEKNFKAKIQ